MLLLPFCLNARKRNEGRLVVVLPVDVRPVSVTRKTFVKQNQHVYSTEDFSTSSGTDEGPLGGEAETR